MAPGWLMEQVSPAIARTLAAIPDASTTAVMIPDIRGISPDRHAKLFRMAVDFARAHKLHMTNADALDLWAIAALLQVSSF